MTHPNRVQPDGTFLATPARGMLMGNRGVLHRDGVIGLARWKHRNWVCCEVSFRGRHRAIMPQGRWTALFFLDEAVAMAAGHRPCGQCRRNDYLAFAQAWEGAFGKWPGPRSADAILHGARAQPGGQMLRFHRAEARTLPHGAMFRTGGSDFLVVDGAARPYAPEGYGQPVALPEGRVDVLTAPPMCAVLLTGYRPRLHPSVSGKVVAQRADRTDAPGVPPPAG